MKFVTNVLFLTKRCSAALHPPLTFIQSAHVRRSLSLTDNHGVEGNETIQDLMKEMNSLKMEVTSAMTEIEAMTQGNPQAISREIKSLTFATMYINAIKESIPQEMKIERGVQLLRPDDRQRRIELAIANAELHPLVDCITHVVLEAHCFYRISPEGRDNRYFDCRRFISVALSMFRINSGIALPTDVVYDNRRRFSYSYSYPLTQEERQAKLVRFQATILIFFQTLLGSQLRIEKDLQGKIMMFCD